MNLPFDENASKEPVKLTVAWYGRPICKITYNGDLRSEIIEDAFGGLFKGSSEGMPTFLRNLQPEGWLRDALENPKRVEYWRKGHRFLSNFTIYEDPDFLLNFPLDHLRGRLADFTKGAEFIGTYDGPSSDVIDDDFEELIKAQAQKRLTPKLSGIQMKMPTNLSGKGELRPSNGNFEFTHIMKFGGKDGFEALGIIEWMGLELAEAAGLEVPAHALVNLGDGIPNALLIERFDIPQHRDDENLYLIEDMCTASGVKTDEEGKVKYDSSMEKVAKIVREHSTDPEADMRVLFRRTLLAWMIKDGDMHLKNISFLKKTDKEGGKFHEVRLSPTYDSLTTTVFQTINADKDNAVNLRNDQLALSIGGKRANMKEKILLQYATQSLKIPADEAKAIIDEVSQNILNRAVEIGNNIPETSCACKKCAHKLQCAVTEIVDQAKGYGFATPEWEAIYPEKIDKPMSWKEAKRSGLTGHQSPQ